MDKDGPVGVFDSGIGGLSVLRHIRAALPHEDLLYFADSGHAPYGDKSESAVLARSMGIAEFLLAQRAKALVVACNTATAAAITALRERFPDLPVVGIEPGLKPASLLTRTGVVGVLATSGTLASAKFTRLHQRVAANTSTRFLLQPCPGLADRIEKGELDSAATAELVRGYLAPLLRQDADTLVLGCTHYPFIRPLIEAGARQLSARPLRILDTGEAVSRRLCSLLAQAGLQRRQTRAGTTLAFTSGNVAALESAFSNMLQLAVAVKGAAPAREGVSAAHPICQSNAKFV